jgi:hypothetical protein
LGDLPIKLRASDLDIIMSNRSLGC